MGVGPVGGYGQGTGLSPGAGYGLGAGPIPGGTGIRGGPTGTGGNCKFEKSSTEQFNWLRCMYLP